jgi:hypothetical protein
MEVIVGKFFLAVLSSFCFIIMLYQENRIKQYINRSGFYVFGLLWVLFRLVPFVLIYVILQKPTNADVHFFYDISKFILDGKLIYRDFWMPYSPLFPYYNLIPILIYDAKESIVFWMLIYELIAIVLTFLINRKKNRNELIFKFLLYLSLPATLILSVLGGQEDISLWLYMALGLLIWERTSSQLWLGVVLAVGLLFTKIVLIFPIIALALYFKKPMKYLLGLAVIGIPSFIILYYFVQDKVLSPLKIGDYAFAPNLVSVISPMVGGVSPDNKALNLFGMIMIILPLLLLSLKSKFKMDLFRFVPYIFCVVYIFMMVFHKSSIANYIYIIMLPLIIYYSEDFSKKTWAILLVWNFSAAVQPSIWYKIGGSFFNSMSQLTQPLFLVDYIFECLYVFCSLYFIYFIHKNTFKLN